MLTPAEQFGIVAGVLGIAFGLAEWVRRGIKVLFLVDCTQRLIGYAEEGAERANIDTLCWNRDRNR